MTSSVGFHPAALTALLLTVGAPVSAQRRIPKDLSAVRGFDYQSAPTIGHAQHWLQCSAAETERDFDYARRLQLNQVRVFIPYTAWAKDKEALRKNLLHLVRAAHQCGIGVMPTLQYAPGVSHEQGPLAGVQGVRCRPDRHHRKGAWTGILGRIQ